MGECVFGVGKQLASENYFDWAAVYDVCGMLPLEEGQVCISGAVENLVDFEWASEKAAAFCEGSPTPLAESCRFRLGTGLGFLSAAPDARRRCVSRESHLREATREIILIHHRDCGMLTFRDDEVKAAITGDVRVRPPFALEAFPEVEQDVRQSLRRVRSNPFLAHTEAVRGFVFYVETGELREVTD